MSKVDLRLQCGMPCSKLEVSTAQHGTLSGAGYLHQSRLEGPARQRNSPDAAEFPDGTPLLGRWRAPSQQISNTLFFCTAACWAGSIKLLGRNLRERNELRDRLAKQRIGTPSWIRRCAPAACLGSARTSDRISEPSRAWRSHMFRRTMEAPVRSAGALRPGRGKRQMVVIDYLFGPPDSVGMRSPRLNFVRVFESSKSSYFET